MPLNEPQSVSSSDSPIANGKRPLSGLRVLEICHMLAGPYCGMLLADLGAEVIKIETGTGDIARDIGPHHVGPLSVYFASLNRNKKSILLDLKSAAGRGELRRLAASADALVTNLRPDAIERLGLTYEALKDTNPALTCVALTGFGLTGPYREYPAYDYIIQALCGIMMLTGEPGSPPIRAGYSVVDNTGGMMAAISLLAGLVSRRGGQFDIALYDVMISQLNYLAASYLQSGDEPPRLPSGGHSYFVPAQIFATADGHIALFITHDSFWALFCAAVEQPAWVHDARFCSVQARNRHRELLVERIGALLRHQPSEYWLERFVPRGIVAAAVTSMAGSLRDKQTDAREMVVSVSTPHGALRLVGNPLKLHGSSTQYSPPPLLGEHTAEICPKASEGPSDVR
jgi:crotonobetainyl-CoA:carnitine CoA-transferase CaiB-like acyl-CoA transferase